MRHLTYSLTFSLVLSALLWTGIGESSDPQLKVAELPADILRDCASVTISTAPSACKPAEYRMQWVGRTSRGELFLVQNGVCAQENCRGWLVVRDRSGTARTLLAAVGELRLELGREKFPMVHARTELSGAYTSYTRFEWSGEQYVRSETRLVHRIDGFECADDLECQAAAQEALRRNDAGRAVRIWQQVHGVNWI